MFRTSATLVALLMTVVHAPQALAQCKPPANTTETAMSAVVGQAGFLASDGKGAYVDGTEGAYVKLEVSADLLPTYPGPARPSSRYLTFNLNSPLDPSAPILGQIQDRRGEVHVRYYLGAIESDGLRQSHSIQELPNDGVFYASERTDLLFSIGGVPHLLMFGGDTWPLNYCRPDLGVSLSAAGSTKLVISRQGDTYTLQAPAGSIGRLFDYSNQFAPVDKGLYRFNFVITMAPKPVKGKGR